MSPQLPSLFLVCVEGDLVQSLCLPLGSHLYLYLSPLALKLQGSYGDLLPDSAQNTKIRALLRSHSQLPAHVTSTAFALHDALLGSENEILRLRALLL